MAAELAYRFVPCDEGGRPRENSQITTIREEGTVGLGSVLEIEILGFRRWEVIEVRASSGRLSAATAADGTDIPLGGTLVCRGIA
jgi:hypothetical protein